MLVVHRARQAPLLEPPEFCPGMSVIGMFGIGAGDGVFGSDGISAGGMSTQLVDRRPVVPAAVAAARRPRAEHLADGHHVVAVGLAAPG